MAARLRLLVAVLLAGGGAPAAGERPPVPPSPPPGLLETQSLGWSEPVWGALRWGMGMRDVARDSREACGGTTDFRWHGEQAGMRRAGPMVTYGHCGWRYLGEPADPTFWFDDGGLAAVEIHVGDPGRCADVRPRFEAAVADLSSRSGPATCLPYADGRACRWRVRTDLAAWLFLARLERSELLPEAADPERCNVFAVLEHPQRVPRTAPWELPSSLVAATTEPAGWGGEALRAARWGMGPGDLRSALETGAPPLGGPTVAFCFRNDAPYAPDALPEDFRCQLTPKGPGRPTVVAAFARGRLAALDLKAADAPEPLVAGLVAAVEGPPDGGARCRWDELPAGRSTVRTGDCVRATARARLRLQRTGDRADLSVEIAPVERRPKAPAPAPPSAVPPP